MAERMRGGDAVFLHLETADTPLHTMKVLTLDTSRRGLALGLEEVADAVRPRLGIVVRATEKVTWVPGFGRPYWVEDDHFDLLGHLEERSVAPPGDRRALDALLSELAARPLDPGRPLWRLTLVHGLAGGRQALVVQVHHAVMDGLAAANTLEACTTEQPGLPVPPCPKAPPEPVFTARLAARALADLGPAGLELARLVRDGWVSHRRARRFRAGAPAAPPFLGARRNFCNARSGPDRVCASSSLSFEDFRTVATAADATINGVLHAIIARALRRSLLERGDPVTEPTVAVFGIASDPESSRRWGNHITPTTVRMHSEQEDPGACLRLTALSCRQGVDLRKETGLNMAARWTDFTCRLGPAFQRLCAYRLPRTVNHVTTANVPGPRRTRWLGDVEVVDFVSFAVTVPPSNCNVTAYSYAGEMRIGLVTTPQVMAEPQRFLSYMEEALGELLASTTDGRPEEGAGPRNERRAQVPTGGVG